VIQCPATVGEMWSLGLAAMRAEGGCFVLTSHPFLSGRPARATALGKVMAEAVAAGDVRVTTLAEVAAHTLRQRLRPGAQRRAPSGGG
jgi:peptidoglycan-N-acetylglucosamine deacetylase